jgi:hypothetical protein
MDAIIPLVDRLIVLDRGKIIGEGRHVFKSMSVYENIVVGSFPDAGGAPSRRNRVNFFELAKQRIEYLLVNCELKPERFLRDLQTVTGFERTPVHNAVNELAADTRIIIRPRHDLQIAPIDLARERLLGSGATSNASSSSSRPSAPAFHTPIRRFISSAC